MSKFALEDILKSKNLSNTESRQFVLATFLKANTAISQKDIEELSNGKIDRVTIYRTLNSFVEKGLIHKVLDDSNALKYALCNLEGCTTHQHHDNHVHFKCNKCNLTLCIEEVTVPSISLPIGFSIAETNLLIKGVCNNCK
jgi:Fur family transcriptional regulator, ferric uptake regulator